MMIEIGRLSLERGAYCVQTSPAYSTLSFKKKLVIIPGLKYSHEIIMDPEFRDTFIIPRPSTDYVMFVEMLPKDFIGTRDQLRRMLKLIAKALEEEFQNDLPPWRSYKALLASYSLAE